VPVLFLLAVLTLHSTAWAKAPEYLTELPKNAASSVPPALQVQVQERGGTGPTEWHRVEWNVAADWRWGRVPSGTKNGTVEAPVVHVSVQVPAPDGVHTVEVETLTPGSVVLRSGGASVGSEARVLIGFETATPFFWDTEVCRRYGLGAAARAVQGKPHFLYAAIACTEVGDHLEVDLVRSKDAALDAHLLVPPLAHGKAGSILWDRYFVSARPLDDHHIRSFGSFWVSDAQGARIENLLFQAPDEYTPALKTFTARDALKLSPAEHLVDQGEVALRALHYEDALKAFRSARTLDPDFLPAWFLELKTLRALGRDADAVGAALNLSVLHREVRDLPLVREYREKRVEGAH
jgi:hypothetical protein